MKELNSVLESKFGEILSGECLTIYREENRRLVQTRLNESLSIDNNFYFLKYIENFLRMRGFDILETKHNQIKAKLNGEDQEFLIDFDHGLNEEDAALIISENGEKKGISNSDSKYLVLISPMKKRFFLMNINNIKNSTKEKKEGFMVLTKLRDSVKVQYLLINLSNGGNKYKAFAMK